MIYSRKILWLISWSLQDDQGGITLYGSLEQRRVDASVIMLYKIIHGVVAISLPVYFEQLSTQTRHSHPWPSTRYIQLLIITNIHFSPCLSFTGIDFQLKLSCCLHLISLVWQFGLWTTACQSTTQLFNLFLNMVTHPVIGAIRTNLNF